MSQDLENYKITLEGTTSHWKNVNSQVKLESTATAFDLSVEDAADGYYPVTIKVHDSPEYACVENSLVFIGDSYTFKVPENSTGTIADYFAEGVLILNNGEDGYIYQVDPGSQIKGDEPKEPKKKWIVKPMNPTA